MEDDLTRDPFKDYEVPSEPDKAEKRTIWGAAVGLQAVDGLAASDYLIDTARRHIEGRVPLEAVRSLIDEYYSERASRSTPERTEEADKVSVRIAEILSEKAFSFSPGEYISIHKNLFSGILPGAGKLRRYNISKKEWVLNGESVLYGNASGLRELLEYDFGQEENFQYKGLSIDQQIAHIARFISRLWQIHIFEEGNTRATAVFLIKYLRKMGFRADNDMFARHSWYFRNALVRANYSDFPKGIYETTEYLELFLRNLLLNERRELHNRDLRVGRSPENESQ